MSYSIRMFLTLKSFSAFDSCCFPASFQYQCRNERHYQACRKDLEKRNARKSIPRAVHCLAICYLLTDRGDFSCACAFVNRRLYLRRAHRIHKIRHDKIVYYCPGNNIKSGTDEGDPKTYAESPAKGNCAVIVIIPVLPHSKKDETKGKELHRVINEHGCSHGIGIHMFHKWR